MRINPSALGVLSALVFAGPVTAQETLADFLADPATQLSRPADRARVVGRMAGVENTRRQNARARATLLGLPLRTVAANGRIQEIAAFEGDRPLYFTTHNANAAISTGANLLRTSPYSLTGAGVTIGMWDGGAARGTHQEFDSRMLVIDAVAAADHATHVGGTLIAGGINAAARGMAGSATVDSYDWNNDSSEMTSRGATFAGEPGKIYLSNHSYGFISGWNYVNGGSPFRVWEWYGSGTTATSIESDYGLYNTYARDSDSLAFNAPYYLIFRSAGNDNTDNPTAGQSVSLSPGGGSVVSYNPAVHPGGDGTYRGGFETIGFNAVAKDVITIGSAADAVTGGIRDPAKATISSFSSCGPTDDGRIKPDLVANGASVTSSFSSSNTAYGTYSGTSMATPNAAGSAALLIQQYNNLFPGQAMRSSTLKGLLIHTADDRGNPGPDYKYGWGLVNAQASADVISDQQAFPTKQRIAENQLTTGTVISTHSIVWDGISPIRATLCWTDPAATALSISDSRSPRLVNNLDLKIIAPNGSEFLPFVMPFVGTWTPASMDSPATTGINNTDNVEQVAIATPPAPGTYQAVVSFSGTLANNSQHYSLLLSGSSAEEPPPPPLVLSSVSPDSGLTGTVTLDLNGTGLRADTAVKLARSGQSDISATGGQLIGATFRCQVDLTGAAAGAWDVVATNPGPETSVLTAAFTVIGEIWSESFDGPVAGWSSQATTGSNSWSLVTTLSHSPGTSYFAPGPSNKTTTNLTSPAIAIGAGATHLQLRFWQNRNLQINRDAGKLEFSVDNGAWFDVQASGSGTAFAANGYNATISSSGSVSNRNEFAGQSAWSGNSNGWVETIVNLTDTAKFAGKNLTARWRIATDSNTFSSGWYVDSITLLGGGITNQAPVIATAATSSSTETVTDPDTTVYQIIRGSSTNLSVTATDDAGESALIYTWSVASGPGGQVVFPTNGSNAAKNTTANFEAPGDYQISVSVLDGQGLATTSSVNLRVVQTAAGLIVSPAATTLAVGATQAFGATLLDQFSVAMVSQPPSFTWSVSGGGTISAAGLFTATAAGGPHLVTASSGRFSNTASVTVTPAPATVTLENLNPSYDGNPQAVTVTTHPPGLAVAVTYDASPVIPTNAGTYAVEASISDPNYQGSATGTLVIGKATATLMLTGLAQTYDGSPKSISVATTPVGLTVLVTYDGSSSAPTNAGSYPVVAIINDPNHTGSASGTLVIGKAAATVELAGLSQTYDCSPKPVTAATTPAGLTVSITYDGSPTPPTNAGSYPVAAAISDTNHMGSIVGTLVIGKATATVELAGLSQTYDSSPKPVTAATTPAGLTVAITYEGSPTPPTNAGSYPVAAAISDTNHMGSIVGTLVIDKATATIDLAGLAQTYDGSPKPVTSATAPAGLTVAITYDSSLTGPTNAGSYAVAATINDTNHTGSIVATLVIGKADAVIDLAGLAQTYDGSPKSVTAATTPVELSVAITYDGSSTAPTNAGSYPVTATINDTNHTGSIAATLVIGKADAVIEFAGLVQTYDGLPKPVTAATTPVGLSVAIVYDGSSTAPTNAGSYPVTATINDTNHTGSIAATLVISKATASIDLTGLAQTYDGSPKSASASTTPAGLTVVIAYEGLIEPPTLAGTYAVSATVIDPNHDGSATASLVIAPGNDWASWRNQHFTEAEQTAGLAAEIADPDSDSWPNLAEYALGTDPRQFTPPLVATLDANGLSVTFTRPANLPDVSYAAESSDELGTWTPVPLELLTPGAIETLRARDPLDTGNPLLRFLRLRFERP